MAEILIPTHGLRLLDKEPIYSSAATLTLQQRFLTTGGKEVWQDVPVVRENVED